MATEQAPLVTFGLVSYNQEKYIREAVEAALAQDYSPLEIIISDDCSSDSTFQIMQDVVASYRGPHAVHLNRNPLNLGIGAHVAKLHSLARGEVIVHAAGDDISMSHRVSKLVGAYLSASPRPSLVESNAVVINEDGVGSSLYHLPRSAGRYQQTNPWISPTASGGSTFAVTRRLLDAFAPIPADFIAEDALLGLRANLLDGVLYIPEPLIKYRVTRTGLWNGPISARMSSRELVNHEIRWTGHRIRLAQQALEDVAHAASEGRMDSSERLKLECHIEKAAAELNTWRELLKGNFRRSVTSLLAAKTVREHISAERWIKMFLIRWAGPLRDSMGKARK